MLKRFLEAGQVVGTHGVKGEMRVQPWCDDADFLSKFKKLYLDKNGDKCLEVQMSRPRVNICLIKVKGIDSIEDVEKMRGKVFYIDRNDCKLKNGSYFINDIIGCKVFDENTGESYGRITDVSKTGANDVWHIAYNDKEYLIPNVPEFVSKVDVDSQEIYITPIKGIFEDED